MWDLIPETTDMLVADFHAGKLPAGDKSDFTRHLDALGVRYTTWKGWHQLDAHERSLGQAEGRERKKVVEWDDMLAHSSIRA